jgi:uncharacterized protein YjiS (DUF1127 family)
LQCTIGTYIQFRFWSKPSGWRSGKRNKRNKNMLLSIINFFKSWKRYGVAVDELSHLSDRELADIGITRGDIPRIAWEQAKH